MKHMMRSCKSDKSGRKRSGIPGGDFILLFALWLTVQTPLLVAAQEVGARVNQALQGMEAAAGGKITATRSPITGLATFIAAEQGRLIPVASSPDAKPEERALMFLTAHGAAFGLKGRSDVQVRRVQRSDEVGMDHVRLQQVHKGVPVTAGELMVHLRGANVASASGKTLSGLDAIDTVPTVEPEQALQLVREMLVKHLGTQDAQLSQPRLEIFNRGLFEGTRSPTHLAWFVEAAGPGFRQYIWVAAHRGGGVLLNFSQLTPLLNRLVYNGNGTGNLPGTLVRSEGGPATGDVDADLAYNYAGDTYNYYFNTFGRDSYDGAGATIISTVHSTAVGCPNAAWTGQQMVYCDGFSAADDVVAHELTHAVTEHAANLFYYMQSGALNESYSDLFGETVDLLNGAGTDTPAVRWLLGEDAPGGAIRDMTNPNHFGQPGKMTDSAQFRCWDSGTDGGGVHYNSGVPNHAYALLVDGGTYNGVTITGIGLDKGGRIEYRALTHYLLSGSDFLDNYNALIQSANDLVGTYGITADDCIQVSNALNAVQMNFRWPCSPLQPLVPDLCPPGATVSNIFFDDLENTTSGNWQTTVTAGTYNHWIGGAGDYGLYWDVFATSGTESFWGYDASRAGSSAVQLALDVPIPTGDVRMQFNHSYGFENSGITYYDGGVLEYSTNAGATWSDAGALIIDGAKYGGIIKTGFGNPLAGRSGFVRESWGYTASQLTLTNLAGSYARFRFLIGTDSTAGDYGWFIDDVRIYLVVPASTMNLQVTPAAGLAASGPCGGGFSPPTKIYTLTNASSASLAWTASADSNWVSVLPGSGNLAAGASIDVSVSINSNANSLAVGAWTNSVTFNDVTSDARQIRAVTLNVVPGARLVVTPGSGMNFSGARGGPFRALSQNTYTLSNSGCATLSWTASANPNWVSLSPASGGLNPGSSRTVTASINTNANGLADGTYYATVTFTNATDGYGSTNRPVTLSVSPCEVGVFSVTGGGPYCTGSGGVPVGLDGSEAGIVYRLKLNGIVSASVVGTGSALSFGPQTNVGTYTVMGTNASTGCWSDMIGGTVVAINPRPTAQVSNLTATICFGGSATISAALNGSPPWNVYWSDGTNQVGVMASPLLRSVSPTALTTFYTITNLTDANCAATAGDVAGSAQVIAYPAPAAYDVTGGGESCAGGAGAAVGLANSQVSVNYYLKCNGNDVQSLPGTGFPIGFGLQTNAGIYTVMATNVGSGCWAEMGGSAAVVIIPRPTSEVSGSTTIRNGQSTTISNVLSGIPPWNLRWSDGVDQTNVLSSPATRTVRPSVTTTYLVTDLTDTNCAARPEDLTGRAVIVVTNLPPNVAASGDSSFDQCGVPMEAQTTIAIAAGGLHSLGLQAEGRVLAWGDNSYGQRDVPATLTDAIAIAAGGYHNLAIRLNGTVVAWGANDYGQTNVPAGLSGVIGIAAGTWHSVALQADGRVRVWGDNSFGQTNQPAGLTNVVAVAAGGNHALALRADGTVAAWGENTDAAGNAVGQSLVPLGLANVVAIAAGEYHSLAVKGDGTVVAWGDNSQGQCVVPPGLGNVVAAAGGGGHSLALRADGTVAAWGANWSGQCDLPPTLPPALGVAAGSYHTLVLLEGNPPLPPQLLNPTRKGIQFSALAQTLYRKTYALEYVEAVTNTNWIGVSTNAGNGGLRVLTDSTATDPQRFYRLRQW